MLLQLKFRLFDGSDITLLSAFHHSHAQGEVKRVVPDRKRCQTDKCWENFGKQQDCWLVQNSVWGATKRSNYYACRCTGVFNQGKNRKEERRDSKEKHLCMYHFVREFDYFYSD